MRMRELTEAEERSYVEDECGSADARLRKAMENDRAKVYELELWYNPDAYRHKCVEFELRGSFREAEDVAHYLEKAAQAIRGEARWIPREESSGKASS
jgi:hypothetical protein